MKSRKRDEKCNTKYYKAWIWSSVVPRRWKYL